MVVLGQLLQHPCGVVLELGLLQELLWVRMRSEVGGGGGEYLVVVLGQLLQHPCGVVVD